VRRRADCLFPPPFAGRVGEGGHCFDDATSTTPTPDPSPQGGGERHGARIGRRDFIVGLAGTVALPLAARAQQRGGIRRIGMLTGFSEADQEAQQRIVALHEGLAALGWTVGRNVQFDQRWAGGDIALLRRHFDELVGLNPDLIVTGHTLGAQLMLQAPRPIPTVFVGIADPVGSGVVRSLARPTAHVTGFTAFEYAIGGKWLSLLTEIAPKTRRVALLFSTKTAPWAQNFWQSFEASAPMYNVRTVRMDVHEPAEIKRAIEEFAREPDGALLAVPEITITLNRKLVLALAAEHRLPTLLPYRYFPADGGLASYGIDVKDMWRRSASYVDRILKGAKPADLPVQAPTKFEFVINLKTAKVLGLQLPPTLIARADEVIE
jgi:putative tryptophan/tyrosine transport system substrate-binding protein